MQQRTGVELEQTFVNFGRHQLFSWGRAHCDLDHQDGRHQDQSHGRQVGTERKHERAVRITLVAPPQATELCL